MLIALTLLFLFGGCASPTGMAVDQATSPELPNRLEGTWIRPINNQPDKIEGIRFDEDGRFGLVGIHTMHGLAWMREDDDLIVTTNTGRYPEPFETRLSIETLTDTTLILGGAKSYFRGAWRRDDTSAARITGQVAYRERIALPPDAAVHLTLEDVSRQDAPATYIASQVIPTLGRQVPIPFALYYASDAIDPRHTYQVRAAIVVDGQRRFMTTQAYPVLTRGNPDHIEMTLQGVQPQHPQSTQPHRKTLRVEDLHLPATYSGQLPHPSGSRGRITLNLYSNRIFFLRKPVETPPDDTRAYGHDHGRWYLAHGGRQLVLVGRAEAPYKLAVKDNETFRLLSLNGSKDRLQHPIDLARKDELDPFEDPVPMTGMFRYMADAALFTECLTEASFPVAQEKDYLALERAYLEHRQTAGEPLLATLTGHLGQRPKMEGQGMESVIVVDRFDTIQRHATCPMRNALARLQNTYWKLTELYGKTIQFAAAGQGEPHLMLRPSEHQMSGFSGCNGFFGLYRKEADHLSFSDLGATMMACPGNPDLEATYYKALKATEHFKIFGELLELYHGREVVARFEAVYF
jgi:copper homeostasis protein (lipoprotein)